MSTDDHAQNDAAILIDVYTAIDLDRTILKSTTLFYDYVIPELVDTYRLSSEVLERVQEKEVLMRGKAFDFIAYLNQQLELEGGAPVSVYRLAESIIGRQRNSDNSIDNNFIKSVLVDGTLELLGFLDAQPNERWGIMTSGGELTQSLKCALLRSIFDESLDTRFFTHIVSTEHKAQTIAEEWFDMQSRKFNLPLDLTDNSVVVAKRVRIIDDKPQNLAIDQTVPNDVSTGLELYLAQAAESAEPTGYSLFEIAAKIQQSHPRAHQG